MISVFSSSNKTKINGSESQKVSYWLEKLFKQEDKKSENEKQSAFQTQTEERSMEKSGRADAIKHHFRKIGTDQHKLDDLMAKSNRIIISASSMFPWDIFPNTINVEERRVTIIHRQWWASQVHSVDIKNISNVFIDTDLFFAALTIVSSTFEENNIKIMKLRKKEAVLTRRIIEGMRMFIEKDIDTSRYTIVELVNKLKELSTTETIF
jgi:hypothetical protein